MESLTGRKNKYIEPAKRDIERERERWKSLIERELRKARYRRGLRRGMSKQRVRKRTQTSTSENEIETGLDRVNRNGTSKKDKKKISSVLRKSDRKAYLKAKTTRGQFEREYQNRTSKGDINL